MTPSIAVVPRWNAGAAGKLRPCMMSLMRIDRWDVRRDGALSEASLQQKLHSLGYQTASREYAPGAVVLAHTDARERIQAVTRGLVKVTIDGESAILTGGDVVLVPRGAVQRVEVIGSSTAHCLEAVYLDDSPSDAV